MKKIISWITTIALCLSFMSIAVHAAWEEDLTIVTADEISVAAENDVLLAQDGDGLEPNYSYNDIVRVSIVMEEKSTMAAGYDLHEILDNPDAMAYQNALDTALDSMTLRIENTIATKLDVVWKLSLTANLISANVLYGQIDVIRNIPGVAQVVIETQYVPAVVSKAETADPNMSTSGTQTGSAIAWAAGYTGAGSRIAIIDTGLDVEHEAFSADALAYSLSLLENVPDGMDVDDIAPVLQQLNVLDRMDVSAEDLYINGKIPFGFNYVDGDLDVSHYNSEHGSHVAGIAAANAYIKRDDTFLPALNNTYVQGMAPDAQLLVMKVFGASGGAYDSDYMAAIEDAILLGADAVNLSLGSAAPGFSGNSVYQELLDSLSGSGVVVTMSAGNNGAWADRMQNELRMEDVSFHTAGAPGTYTNSLSVASVNNDGTIDYGFLINGQAYCYKTPSGISVPKLTAIAGEQAYICIPETATLEQVQAHGALFEGKIIVFTAGANYQIGAQQLLQLNPSGIIICSNTAEYPSPYISQYTSKPIVTCNGIGTKALYQNAQVVEGTPFSAGKLIALPEKTTITFHSAYYNMSSFSSWGVPGSLELKPEITAPGGNIFSVAGYVKNVITNHTSYESMSGTSMAAPQIAGMVALLAQYFRQSGLTEKTGLDARVLAQSLLMSTAVPVLDSTTESYYPVIQQGAGLANVGHAVTADSYILMNADATASWADGKIKAELGDDPDRTGVYTISFDIFNPTDVETTFQLNADFFIQGKYSDAFEEYTLKTTQPLYPNITWKVDGQPCAEDPGKSLPDLNGDGVANADDAQLILEYMAGNAQAFANLQLADLDGNGQVTTYDAYLYITMFNTAQTVVPANGSVTVEVTVTLNETNREVLNADPNGAFIQGYVFAESASGTSHSIPVLGYYGSWAEPSMFDPEDYPSKDVESYVHTHAGSGNKMRKYQPWGDPYSSYTYVGRGADSTISAVDRKWLDLIQITLIRDAAMGVYFVRNTETGEFIETEYLGAMNAVYYNSSTRKLENTVYEIRPYFVPDGIPEGTKLELGVVMFTEYHINQGYTLNDMDKLGAGAVYSVFLTVDNTKPVIESYTFSEDRKTLKVTVSDDNSVRSAILLDHWDSRIDSSHTTSSEETEEGKKIFTFDLTNKNHDGFFIQTIDHAGNVTEMYVDEIIGTVREEYSNIGISEDRLIMNKGETYQLSAHPSPGSTYDDFVWTSSDTSVAKVDANGLVTARGIGVAYITVKGESSHYNATCAVTVTSGNVKIQGIMADGQGTTQMFDWKLEAPDTWNPGNELDFPIASATKDTLSGDLLVMNATTLQISSVDASSGNIKKTGVNAMGLPLWDMAYSRYFSTASDPCVHGIYGNYFLPALDPFALEPSAFDVGVTLLGVTSLGYEEITYNGKTYNTEHVILLCSSGSIKHFWVYKTDTGSFGALTESKSCGLQSDGLYFEPKNGMMNASLLADEQGNLYFSAVLGTRTVLYRIVAAKNKNKQDSFVPQYLTMFERGVGPAVLVSLTVDGVTTYAMERPEPTEQVLAGNMQMDAKPVAQQLPPIPVVSTNTEQTAQASSTIFKLTVTAKDSTGAQVDSTNGLITVNYDPDKLELQKIRLPHGFTAVNQSEPGTVILAYVPSYGVAAGEPILELEFYNTEVTSYITVTHSELGDQTFRYQETVKDQGTVEWVQATTSLEGNIGLNFYVKLDDYLVNNSATVMRFTFDGKTINVPLSEAYHVGGNQYRFTCPINAKNMTDTVTAQMMILTYNIPVADSRTLSVATYCNYMIQNSNDAELVSLMKAMLNYGAAAQVLFDHNTDNLANASLSEEDKTLADVDASAYAHSVTGTEEGIQVYNATLLLETETSIRIYFKLTGSKTIDQYTFKVDGAVVQAKANGDLYYVEIPNIAAQHLDEMHTVSVGGLIIRYGGLSYVNQVIKNPAYATEEMTEAAKALFAYNKMAEAYFN